ncbi:HET-domain-containing protein [Aaosphaeria arxii CBS 175.79]|uniref:HET-domain-containing protein n=1 Tax=Aaosphaeria arxii CBS 175.79 TaxID=1450172 RepID=A0A6A5XXG1_9PLEO|nr:HET-domain-containing protein [Aaosphaeria arxii CBS 175.79]KAF2017636.1 HET-domain-containing protein [Aaosphaeria arxii CBS 175.79]
MVSICPNCKGLQNRLGASDLGHGHAPQRTQWLSTTLPDLELSANEGCRACSLLLQGILLHHHRFAGAKQGDVKIKAESFNDSNAQRHLSVELRWVQPDFDIPDQHEMNGDDDSEAHPDLKLEFFVDVSTPSPFPAIGTGRHLTNDSLQNTGISTIRGLIQNCVAHHSSCQQNASTALPTRLLDVLSGDDPDGVRLCLIESNGSDQSYEVGEYCTLSYCYGTGTKIPRTTTKTLQAYQKNIPWIVLPRTFQQAITLTRDLGVRWLWIDALCIVQDDVTDRDREIQNLDTIFGNSFLTMAATSASDSDHGLFRSKITTDKLPVTDNTGWVSDVYVREQPTHYSFKASFDEEAHMNDWELPFNTSPDVNLHTPLLTRAWAYAESLLARRVLHFTDSELILECREGYQCECERIDNSLYDSRATNTVKQELSRMLSEAVSESDLSTSSETLRDDRADSLVSKFAATSINGPTEALFQARDDALQLWSYIVTEHTARKLTHEEDRLSSIVGVAKVLNRIIQSGYVAGHYTYSTLGLLWYPNDGNICHRPDNSVPSWSWASIEGSPIFFDNATAMDLACTASFSAKDGGRHAWSPTRGGAVTIAAAMATEAELRIDATNEYSLVKNSVSVEFRPDTAPTHGHHDIKSGDALVCVLVSMTFRSSIIGLVLKRSKSEPEKYRRVGRFECYDCQKDGTDDDPEDAESLFGYWFPEIEDMTKLDDGPRQTYIVI